MLEPEAHRFFRACEEPWRVKLRRYWETGAMFDATHWKGYLERAGVGQLTFEEGRLLLDLHCSETPLQSDNRDA